MKLFLRNVTLRKFCFECPFKAGRSGADLTMGDFWKLRKYAPELENDTGVSMVVTHGTRGAAALEKCRLSLLREFPMAAVRFCNRSGTNTSGFSATAAGSGSTRRHFSANTRKKARSCCSASSSADEPPRFPAGRKKRGADLPLVV